MHSANLHVGIHEVSLRQPRWSEIMRHVYELKLYLYVEIMLGPHTGHYADIPKPMEGCKTAFHCFQYQFSTGKPFDCAEFVISSVRFDQFSEGRSF